MSDHKEAIRTRRGEKGFTLIELLVVVTIIGILAAIVSVSVGGFTGKASVQAHKTTIKAVQAAVDAYMADHFDGSGAPVAPTGGDTTKAANEHTNWYNTDGLTVALGGPATVLKLVDFGVLTKSSTTVIANTTRTHGPYLRLGGNASIACVFLDLSNNATGNSNPDKMYLVFNCTDTPQTAQ